MRRFAEAAAPRTTIAAASRRWRGSDGHQGGAGRRADADHGPPGLGQRPRWPRLAPRRAVPRTVRPRRRRSGPDRATATRSAWPASTPWLSESRTAPSWRNASKAEALGPLSAETSRPGSIHWVCAKPQPLPQSALFLSALSAVFLTGSASLLERRSGFLASLLDLGSGRLGHVLGGVDPGPRPRRSLR